MKYKVIYMGTPFFAQEVLEYLLERDDLEVVGVVTQPDRQVGRKKKIVYSKVKEVAIENNLLLFQPEKIKNSVVDLEKLNADAIITCAYGQFLPKAILNMTPIGVINIHASLLPKYRGGAPMQHAIKNGEQSTGITLMKSSLKMDAGDIFSQIETPIDEQDTLSTLELKLIFSAIEILKRDLNLILSQKLKSVPQDESLVSFAYTISRSDELIDLDESGREVYNHIRSLIDNPYAYAYIDNKKVKFCEVEYMDLAHRHQSGAIIEFTQDKLVVALNQGLLICTELQVEGKQRMHVSKIYPGYHKKWQKQMVKTNA